MTRWKAELSDFPEINLDLSPCESFEDIKMMKPLHWRKILENDQLWEDGIIHVLFSDGSTLQMVLEYFPMKHTSAHRNLAWLLKRKLAEYYG